MTALGKRSASWPLSFCCGLMPLDSKYFRPCQKQKLESCFLLTSEPLPPPPLCSTHLYLFCIVCGVINSTYRENVETRLEICMPALPMRKRQAGWHTGGPVLPQFAVLGTFSQSFNSSACIFFHSSANQTWPYIASEMRLDRRIQSSKAVNSKPWFPDLQIGANHTRYFLDGWEVE